MAEEDDVVAVLARQHRRLEARMQALLDAAAAADAAACAQRLARAGDELAVHILAEEQIVYPAFHAALAGDRLLGSLEEHQSLKRLLAELLALDPGGTGVSPGCRRLRAQARRHRRREEQGLFFELQQWLDTPSRQAMGAAVKALERALQSHGAPRGRLLAQVAAAPP